MQLIRFSHAVELLQHRFIGRAAVIIGTPDGIGAQ